MWAKPKSFKQAAYRAPGPARGEMMARIGLN
jgi:hypothetical protein